LAEISRQEPTSACSGEPAESDHEQRVTRSRLGTPQNRAWGIDARPAAAKNFLTYSLVRLGTDHVDVYRLVGFDPAVPIEDTIAAIAEFVQARYVRSDRAIRGPRRDDPARRRSIRSPTCRSSTQWRGAIQRT